MLLASIVINYLLGEWIRRKPCAPVLWTGILLNLTLLSTLKYLPGIAITIPLSSLQKFVHLGLPLGISFWTFRAMSYLFDLYRGEELDPSLVEFAMFMAFFPVTISGPVCRMPEMLPQFRSEKAMAWSDIGRAFGRIATGVLMMQLARLLGQGVLAGGGIDSGFDSHGSLERHRRLVSGVWIRIAALLRFRRILAYRNRCGQSPWFHPAREFRPSISIYNPIHLWTRWHMSLSFWIRDYVFLPLATLRREVWWRNLVLVFSMVLFGLWHNASLLFVIWGGYHGVLLVGHRLVQQLQRKFDWEPSAELWTPLSWTATTTLISLGWIFFRANSLTKASQMLSAVLSPASYLSHSVSGSLYLLVLALGLGYAIVLLGIEALDRYPVGPGPLMTTPVRELFLSLPASAGFGSRLSTG